MRSASVTAEVLGEDDELVAPEARHGVASLAERVLEAIGGGDQELVAAGVAQAVVHHLEVVEVEEEHGNARAEALGTGE